MATASKDLASKSVELSGAQCSLVLDSINLKVQSLERARKAQIPGSPLHVAYSDMLTVMFDLRSKF